MIVCCFLWYKSSRVLWGVGLIVVCSSALGYDVVVDMFFDFRW